jgi:hypothetical protein
MALIKKAVLVAVLAGIMALALGCGDKDITGNDTGDNGKYKNEINK